MNTGPAPLAAKEGTTILVLTSPWPRVYRWLHIIGVDAFTARWWWYDEDDYPLTEIDASWVELP